MKIIPLTQGKVALVDDEDFDWLSQYKWCAIKDSKRSYIYYVARTTPKQNGKQRMIMMHREILGLPKGVQTDHRNGNGLDNQKANLRPATHQQNQFNRQSHHKGTSKYKGVGWHKSTQKWRAHIGFNCKLIHLGLFDDEKEAAKAYDCKAKELFGEFANLNFPEKEGI